MLTQSGRYWKFASKEELDSFLDSCIDANDKYDLNFGRSAKGEWYAYGSVIYVTKFTKEGQAQQEQQQAQQNVTTF